MSVEQLAKDGRESYFSSGAAASGEKSDDNLAGHSEEEEATKEDLVLPVHVCSRRPVSTPSPRLVAYTCACRQKQRVET